MPELPARPSLEQYKKQAKELLHAVEARNVDALDAIATRNGASASVLLWNYADDDTAAAPSPVRLAVEGIPATAHRALVEEYRIDADHSNAFTVWKQMGSPEDPTAEQMAQLKAAGQLQLIGSPRWVTVHAGKLDLDTEQPRESISLLRISW